MTYIVGWLVVFITTMEELNSRAEMEMRKAKVERLATNKAGLIGKELSLDLGSQAPVLMRVDEITDTEVKVSYLRSTPGRTETFNLESFQAFSGIQLI